MTTIIITTLLVFGALFIIAGIGFRVFVEWLENNQE